MRGPSGSPFPEMRAEDVAEIGLHALERGRAVVVPHPLDRLWIFGGRLVPRAFPRRSAARLFTPRVNPAGLRARAAPRTTTTRTRTTAGRASPAPPRSYGTPARASPCPS